MGALALGSPCLLQIMNCVLLCIARLPGFVLSESTFTCFACAGVTEKYHYLNIGDFVPRFADMNVKDVKDARTVDSDDEAPFGPD